MLVLGIILLILFLLLTVILLDPFELRIDTVAGEYCLRWRGLVSVRLTGEVPDPVMRLWVMGWRRDFRLLEMGGGREKEEDEKAPKPAKKKKRRRPKWLTFRLMRRLLHTFRVHTFRLALDTDDYVMNAYLFPVFHLLSSRKRQLHINFTGHNELVLIVSNRIWNLLWAFLIEFFKPKR